MFSKFKSLVESIKIAPNNNNNNNNNNNPPNSPKPQNDESQKSNTQITQNANNMTVNNTNSQSPQTPKMPTSTSSSSLLSNSKENLTPVVSKMSNSLDSIAPFNLNEIKKSGIIEEVVISDEYWKSNVQLNAGYPLLSRYERLWGLLHENNIDLCREAEKADRQLHTVINNANNQFKALKDFEREISALPGLCDRLQKLNNLVDEINKRFSVCENIYAKLAEKKICDNVQQWKKRITDEALQHEESRKQELLKIEYKLRVEKERADRDEEIHRKLMELEIKRKKEYEERKQLNEAKKLGQALQHDLQNYQQSSQLPPSSNNTNPEVITLEQLDLEEDKQELNSFLEQENSDNNNNNQNNDNNNDNNNQTKVDDNDGDNNDHDNSNNNDENVKTEVDDSRDSDRENQNSDNHNHKSVTDDDENKNENEFESESNDDIENQHRDDLEYQQLLDQEVENSTSQLTDIPSSDQAIVDLLSQPLSH